MTFSLIWHRHPMWFLDGNPIVEYSGLKDCIRLLFGSGQSFAEPGLVPQGGFKAAEVRYASARRHLVAAFLVLVTGCVSGGTNQGGVLPGIVLEACSDDGPDSDQDGISDACEHQLARQFAPILNTSATSCNAVPREEPKQLGGGYLYAATPADSMVRVAYLPAYFVDCGWSGAKCRLPGVDCAPHNGDSELIVIELVGAPVWEVAGVFLSAHCFGRSQAACRWYRGLDLEQFEWPAEGPGGPVVWVANGRNANYPSRATCEAGHWWIDTCAGARMTYAFPVAAHANLGSRAVRGARQGCVGAAAVDHSQAETAPGTVECFWDDTARFRGWQADGDGVTPYSIYFRRVLGQ